MYFSENDLQELEKEYQTVSGKYLRLVQAYLKRGYNDSRAREHAQHGFSRRLRTLVRCIENVFEILPPDRVDPPTMEELSDVNINLQTYTFNVFGSVDNLARIWVREKNITKKDGSTIRNTWIGLTKKNTLVRNSFSPGFLRYLEGLDDWFDHLGNFRHAVAHRIPLYVPPYIVPDDKGASYRDLENRKSEAIERGALDDYDRLSAEQDALGVFEPIMTHSLAEDAKRVIFHRQLLTDFNKIDGLGRKMLEELDR